MVAGAFILYCTAYFERIPSELLCKYSVASPWVSCTKDQACEKGVYDVKGDKEAYDYMINWATEIDLYCLGHVETGLLGACIFVGTFVGSFILPRQADVYGRKPLFIIGLILYLIVVVATYFCRNLYGLYAILLLGGISETGRYYVAYVYIIEMMPRRY